MGNKPFAIIIAVLFLALPALTQDVTGNLEGWVIDPENAPIEAVSIIVSGPSLQGIREGVTDGRGRFFIYALPAGG
jgi:hypothetical protein